LKNGHAIAVLLLWLDGVLVIESLDKRTVSRAISLAKWKEASGKAEKNQGRGAKTCLKIPSSSCWSRISITQIQIQIPMRTELKWIGWDRSSGEWEEMDVEVEVDKPWQQQCGNVNWICCGIHVGGSL